MDNEQKIIIRTLYIFLGVALSGSLLVVGAIIFFPEQMNLLPSGVAGVVTCLIMLALVSAKRFVIPRYGLPLVVYGLTTYLITMGENLGVHDEALGLYFLAILLAGLLLGRRGIVVYGPLVVLSIIAVGYAEIQGWLASRLGTYTNPTTLVVLGVVYGIASIVAYLTVDAMTLSLERARQNEATLAESNQALEEARNTLEERVRERTEKAESALKQAEGAQRTLEAQMWQITGQAKLNEILRQEQDLKNLGDNLLSFLCRYLEIPVGTLYLLDGKTLCFSAGFGVNQGLLAEIALGEGVMGQAVQDKHMLTLNSLDSPQLRVVSGLGSQPPAEIVIIPLLRNEQPLGALELGAFSSFKPEQLQFLSRVEESISMTIQTVQTRTRVDELLFETQRQTEELQAQEEELRAANEELLVQTENLRNLRSGERV
jgi:putative methionine-R-sulfoxide reductase with GAF domain